MELEESLGERINSDPSLTPDQRRNLLLVLEGLITNGEFPDRENWDQDDAFAFLVQSLRPTDPYRQSGDGSQGRNPLMRVNVGGSMIFCGKLSRTIPPCLRYSARN